MKKQLIAGIALMVFAFAGAAFTANKSLQTWHYIQKPGECKQIIVTNCNTMASNLCREEDPDEVDTTLYQVYQSLHPTNPALCQTQLFRP